MTADTNQSRIIGVIASAAGLSQRSVAAIIRLLDDGATVPFIARYRKEATGEADEVMVESVKIEYERQRQLLQRKEFIAASIEDQGKLTPQLKEKITACFDAAELEDLYLPFKPKRRTKAAVARERGLEPLARIIMSQNCGGIMAVAARYLNPGSGIATPDDAVRGASDIIAEWISENASARRSVRRLFGHTAELSTRVVKGKEDEGAKYRDYFNCREPLKRIAPHRFLAMCRAQREGYVRISIDIDQARASDSIASRVLKPGAGSDVADIITGAVQDAVKRLIIPSVENEMMADKKSQADAVAIDVFSLGLRQLLLSSPLKNRRIMAIDPGFRTGCKVVCLDCQGNLLDHDVIFPAPPRCDTERSAACVAKLIGRFGIDAIALGDGTASRQTYDFLKSMDLPQGVDIHIVSEQGASIYSASEVARDEFPDQDITVRGAVSIGRRLLDPLAELVKIDPKSIGVGQYQHDVDQQRLRQSLDFTVSSCVNSVGVDLNTASRQLLSYVSGIGPALAENIVAYRTECGGFKSRRELLKVKRLGDKAYAQCAGFLRVDNPENPLDNSAVHPESYHIVEKMARDLGVKVENLIGNAPLLRKIDKSRYLTDTVGMPTVNDIVAELEKPGRDPRLTASAAVFDSRVTDFSDLRTGMVIEGKVVNVTAFGAFVDLGIKENGLLHISEMSDSFVRSAADVVSIGQRLTVRVLGIDSGRRRISLSLKNL